MAPFTKEERTNVVDVIAGAMAIILQVDWGMPRGSMPPATDLKTPIVVSRSGFRAAMACTCFGQGQHRLTDTLLQRDEEVTPKEVRPFLFQLVSVTYPVDIWSKEGWRDQGAQQKLFEYLWMLMRRLNDLAKAEKALLAALENADNPYARQLFTREPPGTAISWEDSAAGNWLLASGLLWSCAGNLVPAVALERLPFAWVAVQYLVLSSTSAQTVSAAFARAARVIERLYK